MKKEDLERLKTSPTKNRRWSELELRHLKECKDYGLSSGQVTADEKVMKEYFPGRTKESIQNKWSYL